MAKEFKEKTITINLKKAFSKPTSKRAKSALFFVKEAVKKESRKKEIAVSNGINETLWARGLYKIPRRIVVKIIAEKERAFVCLPNEKIAKKEEKKGEAKVIREGTPEKTQEKPKEVIEEKKEERKKAESKEKNEPKETAGKKTEAKK
jgi:large subunit ribosomal protein L31e